MSLYSLLDLDKTFTDFFPSFTSLFQSLHLFSNLHISFPIFTTLVQIPNFTSHLPHIMGVDTITSNYSTASSTNGVLEVTSTVSLRALEGESYLTKLTIPSAFALRAL